MNRLSAADLSTLDLGGELYDKNDPALKPQFDQMWKRVTAFSKSLFALIEETQRPFAYEIGKSRNYLQQGGRGKFYYPRFVWIRYVLEGEKRNTPAVSLILRGDSLSFSLDFLDKYLDEGKVERSAFESKLAEADAALSQAGYTKTEIDGFPRVAYTYSASALEEMSDEEFEEEARHHFGLLLPIYERIMHAETLSAGQQETFPELDDEPLQPSSILGTGVAAAALASVRGQSQSNDPPNVDEASLSKSGPRTVVRRRRTLEGSSQSPPSRKSVVETPEEKAPGAQPRPIRMHSTPAKPRQRPRSSHSPIPSPAAPVSVVPPPIASEAPGAQELRDNPAMILHGPPDANLYKLAFDMVGALVHEELCKPKKRHEIILEALDEPAPEDILALALYGAPRGLSLVALQTHDLMLHYYRNVGTWARSLRETIRQALEQYSDEEGQHWIFEQLTNGSWTLTQDGQHFVETNYRYALQEAGKRKPKRYSVSDFAVILSRGPEGFPSLNEVMGLRESRGGAIRKTVYAGPIIKMLRKALKKPKIPHAVVLLNVRPEELETSLGPLFPLVHPENRGNGPYAPSIHIPDIGPLSIPNNVFFVIGLQPGMKLSDEEIVRYGRSFTIVSESSLLIGRHQNLTTIPSNEQSDRYPQGH